MLSEDKAGHLRHRTVDLLSVVAGQSQTMAGWLALDLAKSLLEHAKSELGPSLTPEQSDELDWLAARLKALVTEV